MKGAKSSIKGGGAAVDLFGNVVYSDAERKIILGKKREAAAKASYIDDFRRRYGLEQDIGCYASVYLVYFRRGRGEDIFIMSVEDAKKFCSHPKTKGVFMGGEYIFMWTSLKNLFDNPDLELRFKPNNHSQDAIIEELGIKIYNE